MPKNRTPSCFINIIQEPKYLDLETAKSQYRSTSCHCAAADRCGSIYYRCAVPSDPKAFRIVETETVVKPQSANNGERRYEKQKTLQNRVAGYPF